MIEVNSRVAARDLAIQTILPVVPELGWSLSALHRMGDSHADLLFPAGPAEMVEAYIDLADREMVRVAMPLMAGQKVSNRIRTLIATRLEQAESNKTAVRLAATTLARPINLRLAANCTARTVDAMWYAAGDLSTDFSWYTKRAILAGVYTGTILFWLNDSKSLPETLAFFDRRLAEIAMLGKFRSSLTKRFLAQHQ